MIVLDIQIEGVGGLRTLYLTLHDRMNLICGPNGIGKTTVLECIAHLFSHGDSHILRRNVDCDVGTVKANLKAAPDKNSKAEITIKEFQPNTQNMVSGQHKLANYVFSLKTTRTFAYAPLSAVSKDSEKPEHVLYGEAQNGISLSDTKNWFVNRYLYSAHPDALNGSQLANFELAKKCFSQLNPDFSFLRVDAATNEIMVKTPTGQLYYEYLSSGFKSCLSIMFGIMKEIEYRFPKAEVSKFEGVVLIDEIELHLHPDWQSRIAPVLLSIFPRLQFIATTHSPHVVQNADPSTLVALELRDNKVVKRELPQSKFGFKGWTVEEVLEDVMGMTDTRTTLFTSLIDQFGLAIDREDAGVARSIHDELDQLLHPRNSMRKIIRLQLAGIGVKLD